MRVLQRGLAEEGLRLAKQFAINWKSTAQAEQSLHTEDYGGSSSQAAWPRPALEQRIPVLLGDDLLVTKVVLYFYCLHR